MDTRNLNEDWLCHLDKRKLSSVGADVRSLRYKHLYYPARRISREIWLDCRSYKEFCRRAGFAENSVYAVDFNTRFSRIYAKKLIGGPSKRAKAGQKSKISGLDDVLKMV